MAIWNLREDWDAALPTAEKLKRFAAVLTALADPEALADRLETTERLVTPTGPLFSAADSEKRASDAVSF